MWFVTNGDILMRCPDDISCFVAVVGRDAKACISWGGGVDGEYVDKGRE
jgi:hypothetical protein